MSRRFSFTLSLLVWAPLPALAEGVLTSTLPRDLSPWGMFMGADWVVKLVMIGLAIASVVTWTVWLVKTLEVVKLRRQLDQALDICGRAAGLDDANDKGVPPSCCVFLCQARDELTLSQGALSTVGIKERTESRLAELESRANQTLTQGTGLLATIGATAPFVGLFGTVWGIMNSFVGISHANTTNLAVVAPGIAEALLATAMGLIAAIPAVILYNYLSRQIANYRGMLRQLSMQVMRLVSRDLDKGQTGSACHGHEAA